MLPTMSLPVVEGGLLDQLLSGWDANGWDRKDLEAFRMAADDDEADDDLDDEDDDDLDDEDDDDDGGDDQKDKRGPNARVARANREAAERRRALRPFKAFLKKHDMTLDEIDEIVTKAAKGPSDSDEDEEVDVEALRRDVQRETTGRMNRRVVKAEVKRIAAHMGFADPGDAPLYVDLDDYEVNDDGDVDEEAIRADLKDVLKRKRHLKGGDSESDSEHGNGRRRPKPDRAQGTRGKAAAGDAGRAEAERRFGKRDAAGTSTK